MLSKSDILYTFRLLAKDPGFTILSVFVMAGALGVGILAFTFSYTMFYKPIPVPNGERIYHICAGPETRGCRPMKAFEFAELRQEISTLENVGAYWQRRVAVEVDEIPLSITAVHTEWNMFQLTATDAVRGRTLQAFDHDPNAEAVTVISYNFWQQHFEGRSDALDTLITISGQSTRIVGIMPEGYLFPWAAELWVPADPELLNPAVNGPVPVSTYGLLREGVERNAATSEINNLMQGIREKYPAQVDESVTLCAAGRQLDCDTGHIATLPLGQFGGPTAAVIITLVGILTGFIFVLGVINVGTLLLARTNERLRDTSIRVALGAPRRRLLMQMTGESIVIATAGAALGILMAGMVMEMLNILFNSIEDSLMAFWQVFHVDRSTITGAILLVIVTVLMTSVYPSWRIINGDFNAVMRDGTRGALGLKPGRFSRILVVISVFIITLLVILTAVTGSYAVNAKRVMQELNSDGLMVAQPQFDAELYSRDEQIDFWQEIYSSLKSSSLIRQASVRSAGGMQAIEVEVAPATDGRTPELQAEIQIVAGDTDYGTGPLLEGRFLATFEPANTAPVVVISQVLAELLWPGESAIGKRLRVNIPEGAVSQEWREVVGVFASVATTSQLFSENQNLVLVPLTQTDQVNFSVMARGYDSSAPVRRRVAAELSDSIVQTIPEVEAIQVFDAGNQIIGLNRAVTIGINLSLGTVLFAFAVSIVGIFGLTKNSIQAATQEIGTRRALGAGDSLVRRTFLWRGGKQALTGLVLAMMIVLPITYIFYSALGTSVITDSALPVLSALTILYGSIILAIYFPIHRVLKMEPSEALRYE